MSRTTPSVVLLLGLLVAAEPIDSLAEVDGKVLREAELTVDGPALTKFFKQRAMDDKSRSKAEELLAQLGDDDFERREEASEQLVALGLAVEALLRQGQRSTDVEIVHRCNKCLNRLAKLTTQEVTCAAIRQLVRLNPPGTLDVLLEYAPQIQDESVYEAARRSIGKIALTDGKLVAPFAQALADKEPLRRAIVGDALVHLNQRALLSEAVKLLKDDSPQVRLRVAIALAEIARDKDAVPVLFDLLVDLPANSAWHAEELLYRLAGETAPTEPLGTTEAERKRCRGVWLDWWKKYGDKVDLAKLGETPKQLGYTLILSMNIRGIGGTITELGADNKPRWKIANVNMPTCAQLLPNDRVLIAEQNQNRVTERNLKGEILWERRVVSAIYCQRLPNGHTLLAGRNQLQEIDRKGDTVWTVNRPLHDVTSASRNRKGEIAILTNRNGVIRYDARGKELKSFNPGQTYHFGHIEYLKNNRLLVCLQNKVVELDADSGKELWSLACQLPTSASRLPNGNTLVSQMNLMQVTEFDPKGKEVWKYRDAAGERPLRASRR